MEIDRKPTNTRRLGSALLIVCAALASSVQAVAIAVTITVNTTSMAVANDGQCSLIEAIIAANTDTASGALAGECPAGSGADTIVLSNATYTLTAVFDPVWKDGLPPATSAITLQGNGAVIQRAAAAPDFRLWRVSSTGNLTLHNVTLRGGRRLDARNGAAIYVDGGALSAHDCTFEDNLAQGGFGSAIYADGGDVDLHDMTLRDNEPGALGGEDATLTLNQTTITTNQGAGVELFGDSALHLAQSSITDNQSDGISGSPVQNGVLTIADSQITGNDGLGVVIANSQVQITDSVIQNQGDIGLSLIDSATAITGTLISGNGDRGILSFNGSVQLYESMVTGNAAAAGFPGGLDSRGTAVVIRRSTLANNTPKNITHSGQSLQIVNSTLSGVGEQLTFDDADVSLQHVTLAVTSGNPVGILAMGGAITFSNSIVDRCYRGPFAPTFTSLGYNIDRSNQCGFTQPGDIQGLDPDTILAPLANNGGPTHTRALLAGAAAINAIPVGSNNCQPGSSLDQRGYARAGGAGQGGSGCDIGAFEYASGPPQPTATPTRTPTPTATPTRTPTATPTPPVRRLWLPVIQR
ncbi:MAG TPA: right-handed parallel beta-helix repeat-containing protein [Anaerolineae bacterium]|nr:right-handed parallel beta-helix repeat-containing protein [Anaerolineae bacterium]HNU05235.1 right-handed parallel beta-helix repeat-containing protein [Anaerolineae bacterium]